MADNKDLHEKLMELYPKEYNDIDKDGIIDELAGENGKKVIDALINDYGGGSGKGPKAFKEYADLQAREEYAKFRSKFDKNKQDAINRSQDTQWKTNLRNLTSSVKRLANSDKPTQLTQGLKNGGRIIFDKKNKIMKLEQNTGFEYTKDEAVALGNPDLAGTNKKEMLTINPSQMMDVVFEKWGHEGFEKTFPELFKIYGAGEPIKY